MRPTPEPQNQNLTLAPHESKKLVDASMAITGSISTSLHAIAKQKVDGDALLKVLDRIAAALETLAAQSLQPRR